MKKVKMKGRESMTPQEFTDEVRKIIAEYGGDVEAKHQKLDGLMDMLLRSLGYKNGMEIIDAQEMWYA